MASVTISPNPVAPGQAFTATLSGFAPGSTVFPYFVHFSASKPIPIDAANNAQPVHINSQGGATWTQMILTTTPVGSYTLNVNDGTANVATANIQVQTPPNYIRIVRFINSDSIDLVNGSVINVGEPINAILLDFPPNQAVDVLIQSEVIASGTTAFNGNTGFVFTIDRPGTFDLRINQHGSGVDYGQISVTVKEAGTPDPDPLPGEIDPLWIIGGIVALGGVALVASGGLKKIL